MKPENEWEVVEVVSADLAGALNRNNWDRWGYDVFAVVPYKDGVDRVVFKRRHIPHKCWNCGRPIEPPTCESCA